METAIPNPSDQPDASASIAIEHRVKPEKHSEFATIVRAMIDAAGRMPGYEDSQVVQPAPEDPTTPWRIVVQFSHEGALRAWRASHQWRQLSDRAERLTVGSARVGRANGLEQWFQLPERASVPPPPKWKTAIISGIGIYPLLLILPSAMAPIGQILPTWLATALSVVLMSPLITWVVMPTVTRLFRGWLYPDVP